MSESVTEYVEIDVIPGSEAAFEAAAARGAEAFRRSAGCRAFTVQRTVERPSTYRVIVQWDTLDNHLVDFRNSPAFGEWRGEVSPHFAAPPRVEHGRTVLAAF